MLPRARLLWMLGFDKYGSNAVSRQRSFVHVSRTLETKCLRIAKKVLDEMVKCKYNSISKIEKGK